MYSTSGKTSPICLKPFPCFFKHSYGWMIRGLPAARCLDAQEVPGATRARGGPQGPKGAHKDPREPRKAQGGPQESRRAQKGPRGPTRAQEGPTRARGGAQGPKGEVNQYVFAQICNTSVYIYIYICIRDAARCDLTCLRPSQHTYIA